MAYTSDQEAQALGLIRDWRAYLQARSIMLQQAGVDQAFERDSGSQALEDAEASLALLGQERRRLFEAAFQERRAVWQQGIEAEQAGDLGSIFLDQSQVEQRTLAECLELVEGQKHPDGPGYVRYPAILSEPVTWHDAYLPELDRIPDETAYRIGQRQGQRRERMLRIAAGVLLLPLCALLIWTLVAPETEAHNAKDREKQTTQLEMSVWNDPRLVILGAEKEHILALTAVEALPWPDDGQAHRLAAAHMPVQLCVPDEILEGARQMSIPSDGINPERIYTLSDDSREADVLLVACSQSKTVRRGFLSDSSSRPAARPGDSLTVDGGVEMRLDKIVLRGPAEDSSIPENSMHVIVGISAILSDSNELDWASYAPTLYLLDGTAQAAPSIQGDAQAVELSYLIKQPNGRSEAELRLTGASGQRIRWRIPLEPPLDRNALLGKLVHIHGLELKADIVMLTISNRGSAELVLQANDFVLSQEGLPFGQQAISGLETALAPAETRRISISLPAEAIGELELRMGPYRYRIVKG